MSALIWIQTVCKGYRKTTKFAASKGRVVPMLSYPVGLEVKFGHELSTSILSVCEYQGSGHYLCELTVALVAQQGDKYQNLMSWPIWLVWKCL